MGMKISYSQLLALFIMIWRRPHNPANIRKVCLDFVVMCKTCSTLSKHGWGERRLEPTHLIAG